MKVFKIYSNHTLSDYWKTIIMAENSTEAIEKDKTLEKQDAESRPLVFNNAPQCSGNTGDFDSPILCPNQSGAASD